MIITHVALGPTIAAKQAGCPILTPELLAATGARYSRCNEGLKTILDKVDPNNPDASVDRIFNMLDYGHQSIADMVPVSMFMDNLSIWLIYYVWSLCPTAGGQEASTRYINFNASGTPQPDVLGIPSKQQIQWRSSIQSCLTAYCEAITIWEKVAQDYPETMRLPTQLLKDESHEAKKKVARLKRNFAFDRARYFLPVATRNNMMLIMSARGWAQLCQNLLSHPLPEPQALGNLIQQTLQISAPRLQKHAKVTPYHTELHAREFTKLVTAAKTNVTSPTTDATPTLEMLLPDQMDDNQANEQFSSDLASHPNRYAPVGSSLQRTAVRFAWANVAFSEIRDLNRHRTGNKFSPQIPKSFYFALDQLPPEAASRDRLIELSKHGITANQTANQLLSEGDPSYIYWTTLGTTFPFEHTTTADKFIYEAELRTGLGANFRYAKHLTDVLTLWYRRFPGTRHKILQGQAEPE